MEQFRGRGLSALGQKLHRFPDDVIPYNPLKLKSEYEGPLWDPKSIALIPEKGHSNLPSTYAFPWDEVPDNVKRRTEAEIEAREEQASIDWGQGIRYKDRQIRRRAAATALKWTAGLGTLAGFTYALFSVR